jgi:hypothetical protein
MGHGFDDRGARLQPKQQFILTLVDRVKVGWKREPIAAGRYRKDGAVLKNARRQLRMARIQLWRKADLASARAMARGSSELFRETVNAEDAQDSLPVQLLTLRVEVEAQYRYEKNPC